MATRTHTTTPNRAVAGHVLLAIATASAPVLGMLACSSDSGTTAATGTGAGTDSGATKADGATPGTDSGPHATDAGDATDSAAAADCGKPATLHVSDGGTHCPFSAVDGGKNLDCTAAQQCCETPKSGPASTCVAKGSACPVANSTVLECLSPASCAGSEKCCAYGASGGAVTIMQGACGPYLSKFAGTRCAAACGNTELVVCEANGDCSGGTCTAVKPKANALGVCQ